MKSRCESFRVSLIWLDQCCSGDRAGTGLRRAGHLTCGRPAIVTAKIGLADLIHDAKAGAVCRENGESIIEVIDRVANNWDEYSAAARRMAERLFGDERFQEQYRKLYAEVIANRGLR